MTGNLPDTHVSFSKSFLMSPAEAFADIEWLDARHTLKKIIIEHGTYQCPREGSECVCLVFETTTDYTSKLPPEVTFSELSTLVIGECDTSLGRAVEIILQTMQKGEKCRCLCAVKVPEIIEDPKHTLELSDVLSEEFVYIILEIHLLALTDQPDLIQLDERCKLERALCHKIRGVDLFKSGLYRAAFYRFSKAVKLLILKNSSHCCSEVENDKRKQLLVQCYLNIAACQLETGLDDHVITNCEKVLKLDTNNVKAFYRRGQAWLNLQDYDKANDDFKSVLEREPNNKVAITKLKVVKEKLKLLDDYYTQQMKKMFI